MDFTDKETRRIVDRIAECYPVDHLWHIEEIVDFIKINQVIGSKWLSLQDVLNEQKKFIETWFDKNAYYSLKDEVKHFILAMNDLDPIWWEHLELTYQIKENLYYTPFMVKCDDRDFLLGALEAALAEVKEPMWFDWYIDFHSKGDDEGDYWEINRFEEED